MKKWLRRIIGTIQVGGGFLGLIRTLHALAGHNVINTHFIITLLFLILYFYVLAAGVLLFEGHSHDSRWSKWAQALQIISFSSPFFSYRFFAGFHVTFYWQGTRGGVEYWLGSRWGMLFHSSNSWGIGINVFALVLFVLLMRLRSGGE